MQKWAATHAPAGIAKRLIQHRHSPPMVSCYCAPVNVIIWRFHCTFLSKNSSFQQKNGRSSSGLSFLANFTGEESLPKVILPCISVLAPPNKSWDCWGCNPSSYTRVSQRLPKVGRPRSLTAHNPRRSCRSPVWSAEAIASALPLLSVPYYYVFIVVSFERRMPSMVADARSAAKQSRRCDRPRSIRPYRCPWHRHPSIFLSNHLLICIFTFSFERVPPIEQHPLQIHRVKKSTST